MSWAGHRGGNNNAYCHDNEISWINWETADQTLLEFTSKLIRLRNEHSVFSRKYWFRGDKVAEGEAEDIAWFLPDGQQMAEEHWNEGFAKSVAVYLNGKGLHAVDSEGKRVEDDSFYIIFNAHSESIPYQLPKNKYGAEWELLLTTHNSGEQEAEHFKAGAVMEIEGRSVVLLKNIK